MNDILSLKEIIERSKHLQANTISLESYAMTLQVHRLALLIEQLALGLQHGGGASWPTPDEEDNK